MEQYTDKDIDQLVIKYNTLVKPQFHINDDWIYYLLGEAYEYNILVKPFYKINKNETLSGNVEVFRVAQQKTKNENEPKGNLLDFLL